MDHGGDKYVHGAARRSAKWLQPTHGRIMTSVLGVTVASSVRIVESVRCGKQAR
jgi:hypothetical protein